VRILLDTNILIPLEDSSKALEDNFAELSRLANKHAHQLLVHPASKTDIDRDPKLERRTVTLSRLRKYEPIQSPPRLHSGKELSSLSNDEVDDEILFALERDAVALLVTEDRDIHRKAKERGLSERVHFVQQIVDFLTNLHEAREIVFPNIKEMFLHELEVSSSFFDSLRSDYGGSKFDEWFRKSARIGRKAWAYLDEHKKPQAICIYKDEQAEVITNDAKGLPGRSLKLCTFKVGEQVQGRRIGELFLKKAFTYASTNKLNHIYLTALPEKSHLLDLCSKYGFQPFGRKGEEIVLVKNHPELPPTDSLDPLDYHVRYSPHFRVEENHPIYLIPIQPKFHQLLFPETQQQQDLFTDPVIGNALTLAYLCHAQIGCLASGGVALFYRSVDLKAITTIGIVESSITSSKIEKIMEAVSKRTVYKEAEIRTMCEKDTKVILFRLSTHLEKPIPFAWLKENKIVNGPIQSIQRLSVDKFKRITDEFKIKNCVFAN
jgi:predicted nuclease of predicted toxin-antitoxin system